MTAAQMAVLIGQTVDLAQDSLIFPVRILDVKQRWGQVRALITPVAGAGESWVDFRRLERRQPGRVVVVK